MRRADGRQRLGADTVQSGPPQRCGQGTERRKHFPTAGRDFRVCVLLQLTPSHLGLKSPRQLHLGVSQVLEEADEKMLLWAHGPRHIDYTWLETDHQSTVGISLPSHRR